MKIISIVQDYYRSRDFLGCCTL